MIQNRPTFHDPERYWVAIVGMGAGGARIFAELIERVSTNTRIASTIGILLIDQREEDEFGRGVAWGSTQSDLFRANMRLDTLGLPTRVRDCILRNLDVDGEWDDETVPEDIQFQTRKAIGNCLNDDFKKHYPTLRR